jgi:hypothetical protein
MFDSIVLGETIRGELFATNGKCFGDSIISNFSLTMIIFGHFCLVELGMDEVAFKSRARAIAIIFFTHSA